MPVQKKCNYEDVVFLKKGAEASKNNKTCVCYMQLLMLVNQKPQQGKVDRALPQLIIERHHIYTSSCLYCLLSQNVKAGWLLKWQALIWFPMAITLGEEGVFMVKGECTRTHTRTPSYCLKCNKSLICPPEYHVLLCKSAGRQLESPWLMSFKSVWRAPVVMKVALPPACQRSMAQIQAEFYYSAVYLKHIKLIPKNSSTNVQL